MMYVNLAMLLLIRYLPTRRMNETSMKVLIQHDKAAHPGYCCGEMCQIRNSGQVVRKMFLKAIFVLVWFVFADMSFTCC